MHNVYLYGFLNQSLGLILGKHFFFLVSDWLISKKSSLKPLSQMNQNVVSVVC